MWLDCLSGPRLFLAVIAYFGFNMAAYFMDPYITTVAYGFTGETSPQSAED